MNMIPFGQEIINTACSPFLLTKDVSISNNFYLSFDCEIFHQDIREIVSPITGLTSTDKNNPPKSIRIHLGNPNYIELNNLFCVGVDITYTQPQIKAKNKENGGFNRAKIILTLTESNHSSSFHKYSCRFGGLEIWVESDS